MTDSTITFKKDGADVIGYLVTDDELKSMESVFRVAGRRADDCECGDEMCVNGYVWRCAEDSDRECRWYKSDWRCQPDGA